MSDEFLSKLTLSVCFGASSPSLILSCVRNTLQQMLSDRGYVITLSDDITTAVQDEQRPFLKGKRVEAPVEIVCHLLTESNKLGVKQLRAMETIYDLKKIVLILVTLDGQTSFCKNNQQDEGNIQVFTYKELLVNPTRHEFVPRHSYVDEAGVSELIDQYGPIENFPKIMQSDPIVRYYGWKRGDVLKVDRRCCMAQRLPFYREVI